MARDQRASDIPRGTDVTTKELAYILGFTDCRTVCVENPYVLGKLSEIISELPKLEHIILVDDQNQALDKYELGNVTLHRFRSIVKAGKKWREENPEVIETNILNIKPEETATIIFTSGTTGTPKGVELTHQNFLCQLQPMQDRLPLLFSEITVNEPLPPISRSTSECIAPEY